MYKYLLFVLGTLMATVAFAQNEEQGRWEGFVMQQNGKDTFHYAIDWSRTADGQAIYGQAISQSLDGTLGATFEIAGTWRADRITFDEVRQLAPAQPAWCRKHVELVADASGTYTWQGNWQAEGCQPGRLYLTAAQHTPTLPTTPATPTGHWVGQLVQTDRDDIFYFSLDLAADGTGRSFIISTSEGGEATHRLRWSQRGDQITIREEVVASKTDSYWPWCIKSYTLDWQRGTAKDRMTGDWGGYIELKDPTTARCAPGSIVLEKINPRPVQLNAQPYHEQTYTATYQRTVQVDRVMEVARPDVRLRVWDNGTVDGDRVTLVLNGEQILKDFRVSKRKWSEVVRLLPGENLLVLHADDLGDISPSTVAVSLDDGEHEQIIILNSNLRESGAILMQPFRYRGKQ